MSSRLQGDAVLVPSHWFGGKPGAAWLQHSRPTLTSHAFEYRQLAGQYSQPLGRLAAAAAATGGRWSAACTC